MGLEKQVAQNRELGVLNVEGEFSLVDECSVNSGKMGKKYKKS